VTGPDPAGAAAVVTWEVDTSSGPARVHHHAVTGRTRATVVLGHGAGGGVDAPDLAAVASALPAEGIEVVLLEQPWHVAGRRVAGPAATLDAAWLEALEHLRDCGIGRRRLVAGGRSTGARVACRTCGQVAPDALLLLAFPLHPARTARRPSPPSRLPELARAAALAPTVVVQGTRDRFGSAAQLAIDLADAGVAARVVPVPGADHALAAAATPGRLSGLELVVRAARATALRIVDGRY